MLVDPARQGDSNAHVLFLDQTGQLGGAELCLLDIVSGRACPTDQVLLLQEGPFESALRKRGVCVSTRPLSERAAAVQKSSGVFRAARSLWEMVRHSGAIRDVVCQADLLYANTAKALVVTWLAAVRYRKPFVYHLHDILSADHFSGSNRRLLVFLANRAQHVIANSDSTLDAFVAAGGRRDLVSVVYNGLDAGRYDAAIADTEIHRAAVRNSLGLDQQPVIGLFGRFANWKGQHLAIEALRELPNTHLLLVGDALFGETQYADLLRQTAIRHGVSQRVHFLGFRDDVPAIMQACDLVLHCSTAPEPFGRVIVEAMLSRKLVVASRGGGAAEIVSDRVTGHLFSPGSRADLIAVLKQTFQMAAMDRNQMLERAQNEAKERFDLPGRITEVNCVLKRALSSSRNLWTSGGVAQRRLASHIDALKRIAR
ncbi:glycosyltransferase family 4 protein [Rosistilla carotiformis]|uniref:glycosyltransferase family 4 protein n=1 Tax=Rosistilla carotiformis TaxID=2528017 RepID=UPI0018D23C40|nr:glycosyltransferase family 4 protein [Rosistilla carotiformis]